jgi:hypothetical protein
MLSDGRTANGGRSDVGGFEKGLSGAFVAALAELAKQQGWWRDVLADPSLIIGIRNERLDVYWRGQSLFNAHFEAGDVKVDTHVKYLLDPDRADRVALKKDGSFHVVSNPVLSIYTPKTLGTPGTLGKLKRAADLFSEPEKQGVQDIVNANENVVDVEVRLDAKGLETERTEPRIDIAAFDQSGDRIELVFWEAKLFANQELRAARSTSKPKVVEQINEYRRVLEACKARVLASYRRVAENLVEIASMNCSTHEVGPAVRAVAGGADLYLGVPPRVGLVIFGFDADQKAKDSIGRKHFKNLENQLGGKNFVRARGDSIGLKLFQREKYCD